MQLRLKTPTDIRRGLQKVANLTISEKLDPRAANAFVACCNAILSSLRTDEQERRLVALEKIILDGEQADE